MSLLELSSCAVGRPALMIISSRGLSVNRSHVPWSDAWQQELVRTRWVDTCRSQAGALPADSKPRPGFGSPVIGESAWRCKIQRSPFVVAIRSPGRSGNHGSNVVCATNVPQAPCAATPVGVDACLESACIRHLDPFPADKRRFPPELRRYPPEIRSPTALHDDTWRRTPNCPAAPAAGAAGKRSLFRG